MIKFNVSTTFNSKDLQSKIKDAKTESQRYIAVMIINDCDEYVPKFYGELSESVYYVYDETVAYVCWGAYYARKVYYATHVEFNKFFHKKATSFWFEHAKALNSSKWAKVAGSCFENRFQFAKGGFYIEIIRFLEENIKEIYSPIYFGPLCPGNSISIIKNPSKPVEFYYSGAVYDCYTYHVLARHEEPKAALSIIEEVLLTTQKAERGSIEMKENHCFSRGIITKNASFAFMEENGSHVYTGQFDLYFERN